MKCPECDKVVEQIMLDNHAWMLLCNECGWWEVIGDEGYVDFDDFEVFEQYRWAAEMLLKLLDMVGETVSVTGLDVNLRGQLMRHDDGWFEVFARFAHVGFRPVDIRNVHHKLVILRQDPNPGTALRSVTSLVSAEEYDMLVQLASSGYGQHSVNRLVEELT